MLLGATAAILAFAPPALAHRHRDEGHHGRHHHGTGGVLAQLALDLGAPSVSPAAGAVLQPFVDAADGARPCDAIASLDALRGALGGAGLPATDAATLAADALQAETALRGMRVARACGGTWQRHRHGRKPGVRVSHSSLGGLDLRIVLPPPSFAGHTGNGMPFVALSMDGFGTGGAIGSPGLPSLTSFFAIPPGTVPQVEILDSTGYDLPGVALFPHQDQPADATGEGDPFADPPFAIDRKAYKSDGQYPSTPAAAGDVGKLRDLNAGGVETTGATYVPLTGALHVYRSLHLRVTFAPNGDVRPTSFGPAEIASGWERSARSLYASSLVNWSTVTAQLGPGISRLFCGEELLIITSSGLRPAADTLATARSAAGFVSRVVEVGSGAGQIGTTAAQVQAYIRHELARDCLMRPSYVAIVGDVGQVPTSLVTSPWATGFDGMIATDLPYAQADDSDLLPDLAVGRIPANTLAEANAVVAKIVAYEQSPPINFGFYSHAALTSYFQGAGPQDERGFVKTSQTIANAMEADGRTVDRIYTADSASVNPTTYYDGTAMPLSLRRPGFPWNGTTTDLVNAWNGGRFIVFHRDHGAPTAWGNPGFSTATIGSLTNGNLLPVVFAINCASGKFDDPGQSLDEQLLLTPTGGAVGVVGDSRNSPSFTNNHIALGMFDAIFPNVLPSYGSATRITRMGDVLVAGKWYMNTQNGLDFQDDPSTRAELYLYHWFGDPTMPIRLASPLSYLVRVSGLSLTGSRLAMQFTTAPVAAGLRAARRQGGGSSGPSMRGTWVTVFQNGQPVGRGQVRHGRMASVSLDGTLDPKAPFEVSLDDPASTPETLLVPAVQR
jgi:hypothetical protein